MKHLAKLLQVQNHGIFGSIKQIDLLKFMMELDISYNMVLEVMTQFVIGLDILNVALQIVLIIILQ